MCPRPRPCLCLCLCYNQQRPQQTVIRREVGVSVLILVKVATYNNITASFGVEMDATWRILTNPSNTKSGTISLKNRDFCPKSGTFLKNLAKMAKNGNIRGKMLHTRNHKNRDMPYFIRRKRGTSRILAPKIGTVPPKSGRLESMTLAMHTCQTRYMW